MSKQNTATRQPIVISDQSRTVGKMAHKSDRSLEIPNSNPHLMKNSNQSRPEEIAKYSSHGQGRNEEGPKHPHYSSGRNQEGRSFAKQEYVKYRGENRRNDVSLASSQLVPVTTGNIGSNHSPHQPLHTGWQTMTLKHQRNKDNAHNSCDISLVKERSFQHSKTMLNPEGRGEQFSHAIVQTMTQKSFQLGQNSSQNGGQNSSVSIGGISLMKIWPNRHTAHSIRYNHHQTGEMDSQVPEFSKKETAITETIESQKKEKEGSPEKQLQREKQYLQKGGENVATRNSERQVLKTEENGQAAGAQRFSSIGEYNLFNQLRSKIKDLEMKLAAKEAELTEKNIEISKKNLQLSYRGSELAEYRNLNEEISKKNADLQKKCEELEQRRQDLIVSLSKKEAKENLLVLQIERMKRGIVEEEQARIHGSLNRSGQRHSARFHSHGTSTDSHHNGHHHSHHNPHTHKEMQQEITRLEYELQQQKKTVLQVQQLLEFQNEQIIQQSMRTINTKYRNFAR